MHRTIRIALEPASDARLFELLRPFLLKVHDAAPEIAEIFDARSLRDLLGRINEALSCIRINLPNRIRFVSDARRAGVYPHLTFSANLTREVQPGTVFVKSAQKTQTQIESLTEGSEEGSGELEGADESGS